MSLLRAVVMLLVCSSLATAGDWPQWLGPSRDGRSSEAVAPWKETPRVLWRQPVGEGNSSPVIAEGRAFVMSRVRDTNEEEISAFDAGDGKPLWRKSYPRTVFKSLYGNGPRATPAVSGDSIYTFGITGVLTCFETATGKIKWQKDTLKEFQTKNLFFGMACSPLVEGDKVLVNVGGKGASIVAFDRDTGNVAWKALDDRASYSSPIVFEREGRRQVIFLTGQGLLSLNPADGGLLWRFPLVDKLLESSATPIRAGDHVLASSITYGSVGLRLESKDDKPNAVEVWKNEALTCYFSTPVPVGSAYTYIVTGTKPPALSNEAILHCIETRTGKELWRRPKVGKYHATLLRTGNDKLLMLEEAGNLVLIDPDPKEYRELARSKVCGETWAHPALSHGKLYVRDDRELICLQIKESGQ